MTAPIPPFPVAALVGIQQAGERAGWDDPCPHDSLSGDEGPVADLGRMPLWWRCDACDAVLLLSDKPPMCDCPMNPHHRWNCALTPIWAQTIRDQDCNPWTVTRSAMWVFAKTS